MIYLKSLTLKKDVAFEFNRDNQKRFDRFTERYKATAMTRHKKDYSVKYFKLFQKDF